VETEKGILGILLKSWILLSACFTQMQIQIFKWKHQNFGKRKSGTITSNQTGERFGQLVAVRPCAWPQRISPFAIVLTLQTPAEVVKGTSL
jgi:hypothetical protein